MISKQKKAYCKPRITSIPTESSKYSEIIALLKAVKVKATKQEDIPPPKSK